jgi:hypothetical protein
LRRRQSNNKCAHTELTVIEIPCGIYEQAGVSVAEYYLFRVDCETLGSDVLQGDDDDDRATR